MNYTKPEITLLASANSVIQGHPKAIDTTPDSKNEPFLKTVSAYEADE
jgi:hypothetical protein